VVEYTHDPTMIYGNIYVATMETQRLTHLLDLLMPNKHACMFVGQTPILEQTPKLKTKPRTLNARHHILNPKQRIMNPKPETFSPEASTPNPQP
jgi:hypothetical protein